jgi:hypothetical protein
MPKAKGPFDVKLVPIAAYNTDADAKLARMSLDKQYRGELDATSKGEMLTAMGEVQGSAGYVALERVTGTLSGKRGTFVLQHSGTMDRGAPSLNVIVVPDSGTGELSGLRGKMNIAAEGYHSYDFDYELP